MWISVQNYWNLKLNILVKKQHSKSKSVNQWKMGNQEFYWNQENMVKSEKNYLVIAPTDHQYIPVVKDFILLLINPDFPDSIRSTNIKLSFVWNKRNKINPWDWTLTQMISFRVHVKKKRKVRGVPKKTSVFTSLFSA